MLRKYIKTTYQDKRSGKLLRVYKFLPIFYQELQFYGKTSQ